MREISAQDITRAVAQLCIEANTVLRPDVYQALKLALADEEDERARRILQALIDNADLARQRRIPICQDTGFPQVFVELGQSVLISGGSLSGAINRGIEQGYREGALRSSIIAHPLKKRMHPAFSPGAVHIDLVEGSQIQLIVLPKGFGSEHKSALRMFSPGESIECIKDFIVEKVRAAGPEACPPFIIGTGISGVVEEAFLLAKKALLYPLHKRNPDKQAADLARELLAQINQLGIGPLGLGGRTTCLGVNVFTGPTHIAGLAVAVNISCHALRSATKRL